MEQCPLHAELVREINNCKSDIKELQNKDNTRAIQQAQVDIKLDYIKSAIEKMGAEVSKMAEQPAKRWDSLINYIISAIVSLIVSGGFMAALFKYYSH